MSTSTGKTAEAEMGLLGYIFGCPNCNAKNKWMILGKKPERIDELQCSECGYTQQIVYMKEKEYQ